MSSAIAGARKIYIDANIIIYLIEGNEVFQDKVEHVFEYAEREGMSLITSEISVAECLYGAYRANRPDLVKQYRQIFDDHDLIRLVPVEFNVCTAAAETGAHRRLKLIDAIHVASASEVGCDVLVTNDKGIRSTDSLRVVQLSEL